MTDYWISGAKYWCEDCKKFISDNKASRKHHESGATHQENRRKRIADMKNKQKEQLKEDTDMDREIQRLRREAHKQIYDDIANQVPIAAKEYVSLRQESSNSNNYYFPYDYPTVPLYKKNTPLVANPGTVPPINWNYFDEEMIEAQRRRLFGNRYAQAQEDQEKIETALNTPPSPPPSVKKPVALDKPVTRYNAGIAGEYKEVDPNQYYNEYYSLAGEEEQIGQGIEGLTPEQYYYYYHQNYYYPENMNNTLAENTSIENPIPQQQPLENEYSSKTKRNDSGEEEEENNKEIDITQEKPPEISLQQAFEADSEYKPPISFKIPKNTNKKPRRK